MSKDREKRDQKRRAKLEKIQKKRNGVRQPESLAYLGKKYQTDELIPSWMQAEIGIYEAYVMADRKIYDQTVVNAVEALVKQMRAGPLPPVADTGTVRYEVGNEEDLIIANIRRNWEVHFATNWKPPKEDRIGVLRTILGSIEKVRAAGPRSQSYMRHIEAFLTKKLGVSVQTFSEDMQPMPAPEEDELVRIGRQWTLGDNELAKDEFLELVGDLLRLGQTERVLNGCHELLGEQTEPSSEVVTELTELIQQVRQSHMASLQ